MIRDKDLRSIQEVRILVEKAKIAQIELKKKSQAEIDRIVKAMADIAFKESEKLAKMAVEETGFGIYEDKIIKNQFASKTLYEFIKDIKTVGIINEDKENRLLDIAMPVGVIAGIIPSTNPTSTAIYKALISIKAGNAIIFSPHPSAVDCISETARVLYEKAVEEGAPEGIIGCMTIPTLEGTNELMKHKDISLILATGGAAMVKAAYSSGTPALGVGPGNVPAFIERSADISIAVKRILQSKTFDNGTICASEQAIVTENCIKSQVQSELVKQGAYFLNNEETEKVSRSIQREDGSLNSKIVGQSAMKIAKMSGVEVPSNTRVLVGEQVGVGKEYPFSREKLSPLLAFYSEENWEKACERCIELLEYGGLGHSLAIHSKDEKIIHEFALKKPVSRILVNTPASHGAIGATTKLAPSLTLGCGAGGGSATSDNVSPLHLLDIKKMVYGIKDVEDLQSEFCSESPQNALSLSSIDINIIAERVLEKLKNK